MEVAVIGLGYVGCVTAVGLANAGHLVTAYDIDQERVACVNRGESPVPEPGLERALWTAVDTGNLQARCEDQPQPSDLALVCVGTPSGTAGAPALDALLSALQGIGRGWRTSAEHRVVAIRSTVLPGLVKSALLPALEEAAGRHQQGLGLCTNPEFLREGTALADFAQPPFTLVGSWDASSGAVVERAFSHLQAPVIHTDPCVAMMVKYACNAFHAAKVSFANEIGNLCHANNVDGRAVMRIVASDTRLNLSPAYMAPGFAYGGSCLPKDLRALLYLGQELGVEVPLLDSIERSNLRHFQRGLDLIMARGGQRIGVIGLSFKARSGDLRESPMVRLCAELSRRGLQVRAFDPDLAANPAPAPALPPIADDLGVLLQWADVVVLGKRIALDNAQLQELARRRAVVDLTDVDGGLAQLQNYRGI